MRYDPDRHHRRSIRLKDYDYAQAGAYFVTLCIHQRRLILGHIDSGIFYPSPAGLLIQTLWAELPQHYPGIALDAFTLMPNHLHGIILLQPTPGSPNLTLGAVIHRFKSFTTTQYRKRVYDRDWEPFVGRLWQRNYYEHIIRSEESCDRLRSYIFTNPQRWAEDTLNPHNPLSIPHG
jgi:putative transposase